MELDELFDDAVRVVFIAKRADTDILQKVLDIGFIRAATILEQLEKAGAIGPALDNKPRKILVKDPDEFLSKKN